MGSLWALAWLALGVAGPAQQAASGAKPQTLSAEAGAVDAALVETVRRDLCSKRVALLGQADHGTGEAIAFKAALVEALVTRCGYRGVFFESSHYDFLEFMRRIATGEKATEKMLASAIGNGWRYEREVQPLIAFMHRETVAGRLALGGIDDAPYGTATDYSLDAMPAELAAYLPGPRRSVCGNLLQQRMGREFARYDRRDQQALQQCLAEMRAAIAAAPGVEQRNREVHLQMVSAVGRFIDRDFTSWMVTEARHDQAMFDNFRWLVDRLPKDGKVIVWGTSSHIVKDGTANVRYTESRNFGSYVHELYGRDAFALGFSAGGGERWSAPRRDGVGRLSPALAASIEARALAKREGRTAYVERRELASYGRATASVFFDEPARTDWSLALDGLIVFPLERAPTKIAGAPNEIQP